MRTTLLTSSAVRSDSTIARELCKLAGLKSKGNLPLEDLLDSAVDKLLSSGSEADSRYAEQVYSRYVDACVSWRTVGADVDDNKSLAGVGDYTRESSRGIQSAATPHSQHFYHKPRPQYLRSATQEEICGPTVKQEKARKSLAGYASGRKVHSDRKAAQAAASKAYRERIRAKLLASK
jgi:hypothetical protein